MDNDKKYFKYLFVGGEWKEGKGSLIKDINPWTMEEIATIKGANVEQINEAYEIAHKAQEEWAALLPMQRSVYMQRLLSVIESRADEFVDIIVRESGSTLLKAKLEVQLVLSVFRTCVMMPYEVNGEMLPSTSPGEKSIAIRQPLGVIGLISPWNFPAQLTARTLGPALAVGNAVVVKPASNTFISGGTIFASFAEEAGLPKGLLSVLPGKGSEIGTAFVVHPISSLISFTGSTEVGIEVGQQALGASIIKKTELELGGNSPFVVLEDADIDTAATAAAWGKFFHQGQICMAINRIIVVDKVYDEFVNKFIEKVKTLIISTPDNPNSFIGPIIDENQLEKLTNLLDVAKTEGYKLAYSGGDAKGLMLPPHVFVDVKETSVLAKEEIFGPIAIVMRAKDEADALRMANNTNRGLSSAVFTHDAIRGMKFAQNIVAGMTHINNQSVNDSPFAPFGGEKNSGIGRFNGKWAINAFTRWHWITNQVTPLILPFSANDIQ